MNLAQFNVAKLVAPTDDPAVAEFMDALGPINALADEALGFVWRLQTDEGDATSVKAFDDDLIILNFSVWGSVESLRAYVYKSEHLEYLRRRREWFEANTEPHLVLWWIPVDHTPDVTEAVERLEQLRRDGPSDDVFTFGTVPRTA